MNVANSNGKFEVEELLEYKVEGDYPHESGDQSSVNRWKPKCFPMKPKTPSVSFVSLIQDTWPSP